MNPRQSLPLLALTLLFAAPASADKMKGLGVALGTDEDTQLPMVIEVFAGSPAAKAGLPKGAIIQKINAVPTAGLTLQECVNRLRGPDGLPVALDFMDPVTSKSRKMVIVRGEFELDP